MILYRPDLISITSVCILATALAGAAELPQALVECRALDSAAARLDCYDNVVDAHNEVAAPVPADVAAPVTATTAVAAETATTTTPPLGDISQEDLFGKNAVEVQKSVQEATGTTEMNRLEAFVSKVRSSATGKAIITLDNGQVWTQIDSSSLRLSGYDKVIIKRASLGSYMLNKVGSKTTMRVKRIS